MMVRPQDQVNDIASFGLFLIFFGFMARMARDLIADTLGTSEESHSPGNPGNPGVRLVGVGERPERPEEVLERHEEKLERRRLGLEPGPHVRPLLTEENDAHLRKLRAQGLTYKQIAERTGFPVTTIFNAINRKRPRVHQATTPERLDKVMALRWRGLSLGEIGKKMNISRTHVLWLLHRAGERVDVAGAAADLLARLRVVSDRLSPPATVPRLTGAADRLEEITKDAQLLLEITPVYPVMGPQPGDIVVWALLAEEVLRTGVWCLKQKERGYEVRTVPVAGTTMKVKVEMAPRREELYESCGKAALDAARGVVEQRPGYETKAAQIVFIVEEMMAEVEE